jgi:hypothetical protein
VSLRSGQSFEDINLVHNGNVITTDNHNDLLIDLGLENGSTVIMALRVRGGDLWMLFDMKWMRIVYLGY